MVVADLRVSRIERKKVVLLRAVLEKAICLYSSQNRKRQR